MNPNRKRYVAARSFSGMSLAAALLLFAACGPSRYRVEGEAPAGISAITLLDSTAVEFVDSVQVFRARRQSALDSTRAALSDSLADAAASFEGPLKAADQRIRKAQARYADAFRETMRYLSFGGNPVFTEADVKTSTEDLLASIADRSHRGKAFSLETEAALRATIRSRLKPIEGEVRRAIATVGNVRRSRRSAGAARERAEKEYLDGVETLRLETNAKLQEGLMERVVRRTTADSGGRYAFADVNVGKYFICAEGPLPDIWLEDVAVEGHRHVRLIPERKRRLLAGKTEG